LNAVQAIKDRQNPNGLLTTWMQDGSSWLYGQGLALRVLTDEGVWEGSTPANDIAVAAEKLARFLAANQTAEGYWPRAWNASSGNIIVNVEGDNTVWMGDFPWIPGSLANYYRKSGDGQVLPAIIKAKGFLYHLIELNGKVNTINIITRQESEVSNYEGYAAALYCLLELGDTVKAKQVMEYLMDTGWDGDLQMWKEGPYSTRPVLLVNTWMSAIASSMDYQMEGLNALSLVGKLLYTRGPGTPWGFDGIGPIATWYEGTLSYIASGGPGSNALFTGLKDHINADGSVPAYNDNLGAIAGIWAVDWSSLDATSWLYFAAAQKVPFGYNGADPDMFTTIDGIEPGDTGMDVYYHQGYFYIRDDQSGYTGDLKLELYGLDGTFLGSCTQGSSRRIVGLSDLTGKTLSGGNLYIIVLGRGERRVIRKFVY
jgi:hypothetical protein